MYLFEKFDFSSKKFLALVVIALWVATLIVCDVLTVWLTWHNFPHDYDEDIRLVRIQAMITATILAIPTYICFLWFIRQLETMRQQLTDNVRHDDLTGLLARDAFLEEFTARHENQTKRVDQAFLIIDADYFKRINDNYGHHVGDRALLAITRALKSGIRETDRIGRLGGEEFAIHLKDVSASTALEIAERLRKNVEEASADLEILEFELTVSIGGIFYNTKQDVLSLITAADRQLYRAKDNGRNRVEFETQMELSTA